jgi:uncharacterized protein (TIGR03437 family)
LLRYHPRNFQIVEECFQLWFSGAFAVAASGDTWIAAGRTRLGMNVPDVHPPARIVVGSLNGIRDNSGPVVIGAWSFNSSNSRPLLAAGSPVTIYGEGIGARGAENTSVQLGSLRLPILYAGTNQINAFVPADAPIGMHSLVVSFPFFSTVPVAVDVAPRWPGLYSGGLNEDGTVNSQTNPARRGSIVSLFASGLGPQPLPILEPFIAAPDLGHGGAQGMEVLFVGQAPGAPEGVSQVNARIPANAQSGEAPVKIVIRLGPGPGSRILPSPLGYIYVQ